MDLLLHHGVALSGIVSLGKTDIFLADVSMVFEVSLCFLFL